MIKKILLFCVFLNFQVYGQSTAHLPKPDSIKKGLSKIELKSACEKFKSMLTTETYKNYEGKTKFFAKKMGDLFLEAPANFYEKEVFIPWLKKNIAKTSFASMQEAELLIEDMVSTNIKVMTENKELYNLFSKATAEQFIEIRKPLSSF